MAGFSATEWIAAAPQTIFDFMIEPANASKVMDNVTNNEWVTDDPVGVGSRFRETRVMNGKEATSEIEITAYEPPHRYSATSTMSGITASYHYTLAPERDGTRIDLTAEVSGSGVKKLMVPIVVGFMKRQDGDHLQNLKKAVEHSVESA